ncbi:hypothetical protein THASP1DRAFT_27758 [Thamnocephalis sphaerospora]|uniref:F-box domain-containing protein n=1 Tax=Thamnocephalis sphaerospora TaxID=78915 RepID=A0A4P9XW05_9FUNG|nr:hypothetical protein THASP1DRAFT_27758 [Thamnocephalis sphaerospora]|eukprot:RKP10476.1 hypothetical protein THASP1DRAFT_27758 [Thamnocephalis sphaerospora]
MKHIPDEVLDRIIAACDDEAALITLALSSKRLRARVVGQQKSWRARYEQHFTPRDDNEQKWLRQYKQTRLFKGQAGSAACSLSGTQSSVQFDWFDIYCKRRATEHRWRHGHYIARRLRLTDTRPHGVRLQSIPYAPKHGMQSDVLVASQWLLAHQQSSVWFLEEPFWGSIDTLCLQVRGIYWSEEYLVIQARDSETRYCSLYVWHFSALHRQPRVTEVGEKWTSEADIRGNWLMCQATQSSTTEQHITIVYDLAQGTYCSETLGDWSKRCILRATAKDMDMIWIEYDYGVPGTIMVTFQLWRVTPGQSSPFQLQVAGGARIDKDRSDIKPQRVDDDKFIIWTAWDDEPDNDLLPTVVLIGVADSAAGVLLERRWARSVQVIKVQPIVSRGLLDLDQGYDMHLLLSLADGTAVHRVQLYCWHVSGLYPPSDQWSQTQDDAIWWNPKNDPTLSIHKSAEQISTPTATLYGRYKKCIVVDYTEPVHRSSVMHNAKKRFGAKAEQCAIERDHLIAEEAYIVAKRRRVIEDDQRLAVEENRASAEYKRVCGADWYLPDDSWRLLGRGRMRGMAEEDIYMIDLDWGESDEMRNAVNENKRVRIERESLAAQHSSLTAELQRIRTQLRFLDDNVNT